MSNKGNTSRTGTITVKAGTSSKTCTVVQEAGNVSVSDIGGTVANAVDIGLSVMWASHNLGADAETKPGVYLAWGELEEKKEYKEDNYQYYDNIYESYIDIGDNIHGTKYDAAHIYWGNGWRMPSWEECVELMDKCKWEWVRINEVNGYKITGPNGNSIFIPAWGHQQGKYKKIEENKKFCIWSGYISIYHNSQAALLNGDAGKASKGEFGRIYGVNIRPVKKKSDSAGGGMAEAE